MTNPLAGLAEFIEDPDLAALEARGAKFNVFGALGLTHRERAHSDMIAWLCDPTETHGLGGSFARLLVRHVARASGGVPGAPSLFEVDGWDFSGIEVRREWRHIDLLLLEPEIGYALVLENKVWSGEHSDQLVKYKRTADDELAGFDQRHFVFLSPSGAEPSHEEYTALSYAEVADMLGALLESRQTNASTEVLSFIRYYRETIMDHITGESEVAEICQRIYRTHRQAITLIMEHVPDLLSEAGDVFQRLVDRDPDLIDDKHTPSLIRFLPASLDSIPKVSEGWTPTGRILLFEFRNVKSSDPTIQLYLGPGDESVRAAIYERARNHRGIFRSAKSAAPSPVYQRLFSHAVVARDELVGLSREEMEVTLQEVLETVKQEFIAPTVEALKDLNWDDFPSRADQRQTPSSS